MRLVLTLGVGFGSGLVLRLQLGLGLGFRVSVGTRVMLARTPLDAKGKEYERFGAGQTLRTNSELYTCVTVL